jgi:hypothetical protein
MLDGLRQGLARPAVDDQQPLWSFARGRQRRDSRLKGAGSSILDDYIFPDRRKSGQRPPWFRVNVLLAICRLAVRAAVQLVAVFAKTWSVTAVGPVPLVWDGAVTTTHGGNPPVPMVQPHPDSVTMLRKVSCSLKLRSACRGLIA